MIAGLSKLDAIAPVQEALSERYPILRPEQATSIVVGPQGIQVQAGEGKIWRFFDRSGHWRVSLATEFVALETRAYVDRRDFIARLRAVLEALPGSARPAVYERLGLRFVNRLKGADVEVLPSLVQPELLGIAGSPIAARAVHSLTETSFAIGDDGVNARWGLLPPGGTPDPATIEALPERSWLLDLDAFSTRPADFSVDEVADRMAAFAGRIYSLFRWAVTDEFLSRFGGAR